MVSFSPCGHREWKGQGEHRRCFLLLFFVIVVFVKDSHNSVHPWMVMEWHPFVGLEEKDANAEVLTLVHLNASSWRVSHIRMVVPWL